ncbi:MAG: acyltransferase [Thermoplasmata archaeon]
MGRKLEIHPSKGEHNSLWYWKEIFSPYRTIYNFLIVYAARFSPSFKLTNALLRSIGVKIGKNVSISLGVGVDIFRPDYIEIGDETIIGFNTVILTHEFLQREYRLGRVKIGKRCVIGANSLILAGVEIKDDSVVAAGSLVNKDVDGFYGGVPVRKLDEKVLNVEKDKERKAEIQDCKE